MVAADIGGAGEEDDHDEDKAGGHHGAGVEEAGEEVDEPLGEGQPVLVLDLEGRVLGDHQRQETGDGCLGKKKFNAQTTLALTCTWPLLRTRGRRR